MDSAVPPPPDVLRAFGATGRPVRVTGGQGQAYRSGDVVLKPARDDEETAWIARFSLAFEAGDLRVPEPLRTRDGGFVADGWQAFRYAEGRHVDGHWREKIEVCLRFHRAIAGVSYPAYFSRRDQNPWVIADKVTWGEMAMDHHPRIAPVVAQLRACLRPVDADSQLIHGDFGGNVLFSDTLPPAVIDFSPYWRPVAFAVGVIVADAIVWEGAEMSLIDDAGKDLPDFYQHLARAELRRVIELDAHYQAGASHALDEIEAHLPLVEAIVERRR
ncbi:MAG: phosphotransferase [Anaerolineae bacterium]|nr:phosphotransferase [Anaerolineae bacterium]